MSYFDRYLDRQMEDPEFRDAFNRASAEISAIDEFIRALDERREACQLSKAALARLMDKEPATVRKLFSADSANPTLRTVLAAAEALELDIHLVPRGTPSQVADAHQRRDDLALAL